MEADRNRADSGLMLFSVLSSLHLTKICTRNVYEEMLSGPEYGIVHKYRTRSIIFSMNRFIFYFPKPLTRDVNRRNNIDRRERLLTINVISQWMNQ